MIKKSTKILVTFFAALALIVTLAAFAFAPANYAHADTGTVYTITFNANGGTLTSGAATVTAISGTTFSAVAKPTYVKPGHTFSHWSAGAPSDTAIADSTTITDNITVYANWTATKCQITFNPNGGTRVGGGAITQNVDYGASATVPIVTRNGYTFAGWEGVYQNVTQSATVTAKWTAVNYTVSFNVNGGILAGGTITATVGAGTPFSAVTKPSITRTGYAFSYYSTDAAGNYPLLDSAQITANTTAYAQWKINSYIVTYNPAGGELASGALVQVVKHGGSAEAPIVTRVGYTFAGWSDISTSITANREISARWTPNTYTVTYDVNDGSLIYGSLTATVESGTSFAAISRPTIERAGYTFAYYAFDAAGNSIVTDNYTIGGNITIYAVWKVKSYTVTFDANGGTLAAGALEQFLPGGTLYGAVSVPTVEKAGYTFSHWVHSNGQTFTALSDTAITKNTLLTAVYNTNNYTVTFELAGGTLSGGASTLTVPGGTLYKNLAFPTVVKTGYVFGYWECNGKPFALAKEEAITSNVTITAVFGIIEGEADTYTLLFDANGGSVISGNVAQTIINGTCYGKVLETLPAVSKAGYTFEFWATGGGVNIATIPSAVITADTTLVAVFSEMKTYTVTFELAGGVLVGGALTQQIQQGGSAITPIVTREGYIFTGWEGGDYTNVNGNMTLTAKWRAADGSEPGGFSAFWQKVVDFFSNIFNWFKR